uniref:Uncharacterized protein n=1 Tax=Nelumbo nucifera TaxID=4432 RepID=A0A822XH91_NELNU|nr:TPA_asm: hypothetical protein HUJ06_020496 [Nelumbo nucifera]
MVFSVIGCRLLECHRPLLGMGTPPRDESTLSVANHRC